MNKWFVSAIIVMTSLAVFAAPRAKPKPSPTPELSVREEALKENSSIDEKAYKKTIRASEAQQADVSSFLKLQDPAPELKNRPWSYEFSFKLQGMKPMGTGHVADTTFALSNYGTTVMPSLDFGFMLSAVQNNQATWGSGLGVHAGYMAQQTTLLTPSGYQYNDARLSTGMLSLVWNNRYTNTLYPKWSLLLNPEVGVVRYTQTSLSNPVANFSQQNNYWGSALGVEYALTKKWGVLTQYSYRQAASNNTSEVQKDNLEVGTSVLW